MSVQYKRILTAIDLTEECEQVLAKAKAIADGAEIFVTHVSQPLAQVYGGEIGINLTSIEADLFQQAKSTLAKKVVPYSIPEDKQYIGVGNPAGEIRRYAEEINADLIVVGTHSRHGLGLLLGSTANGVLHGAHCDVLAVKINTAG